MLTSESQLAVGDTLVLSIIGSSTWGSTSVAAWFRTVVAIVASPLVGDVATRRGQAPTLHASTVTPSTSPCEPCQRGSRMARLMLGWITLVRPTSVEPARGSSEIQRGLLTYGN